MIASFVVVGGLCAQKKSNFSARPKFRANKQKRSPTLCKNKETNKQSGESTIYVQIQIHTKQGEDYFLVDGSGEGVKRWCSEIRMTTERRKQRRAVGCDRDTQKQRGCFVA